MTTAQDTLTQANQITVEWDTLREVMEARLRLEKDHTDTLRLSNEDLRSIQGLVPAVAAALEGGSTTRAATLLEGFFLSQLIYPYDAETAAAEIVAQYVGEVI